MMALLTSPWLLLVISLTLILPGCGPAAPGKVTTLVLAGGSGPEEALARKQIQEFQELHPEIRVTYQATPSSASERHTLYVTWLSSRSAEIDVLSLDVIWVAEFAAAGWLAAPGRLCRGNEHGAGRFFTRGSDLQHLPGPPLFLALVCRRRGLILP